MITKDSIKSWVIGIGIFLLILVGLFFSQKEEVISAYDKFILNDSISKSKVIIDGNNKKITDSEKKISELDKQKKEIESKIDSLDKTAKQKNQNVTNLLSKEKELHKKIDSYNTSEIAEYFGERYCNPNAVGTLPNATVLQDTVGRAVVKDLVSYDVAKANIKIKNEIIKDKDSTIGEHKKIIVIQDKKLSEKDTINNRQKNTISQQNKIAENQNKIIVDGEKKLKNSDRKITVGGVIIGILTALLILK